MTTILIPPGGSSLIGGALPVTGGGDVLVEFRRPHRNPASAPVRDAFVEAWAAGFIEYQDIAAYAAAQCDPLRATGEYLKSFADERGVVPGPGESEASVRARLFAAPKIVTRDAIREGVDALIAPFTDETCEISELNLDGWFVHDGTGTWDSFIEAAPNYPSRYYDDLPWLRLDGAVPSWGYDRSFLLRVPALEENDATVSFVLDTDDGIFVGDGSDAGGAEADGSVALSVFEDPRLAEELYSTIISFVETVKGQGITWAMLVDPT